MCTLNPHKCTFHNTSCERPQSQPHPTSTLGQTNMNGWDLVRVPHGGDST